MNAAVYQFGDYRLDCGRFELLRNDRVLRLERKPMELLILLLERNGQLVTRTEIAERLWSTEVFVDTEHGINTAIRKIRQALDDNPEAPQFVQTVTGKGYRFAAPVVAVVLFPPSPSETTSPSPSPPASRGALTWYIAGAVCTLLLIASLAFYHSRSRPPAITYTQLTDFTDSAVAPALSPDGRMMAFIRGSQSFLSSDQIYVKMLPDGEAQRITNDSRPKYGLAFSPDGSQIAYTVMMPQGFATYTVSILGGESHLLLTNSAGLTWLNQQQLLFSQFRSGIHLGVVTATVTRSGLREIYFPPHERAMAHYSYPSPDRHWALVVEMSANGGWSPCLLISLDGQQAAKPVGPDGPCTSAGWSPDGSWMYFTAAIDDRSHVWRQRFPNGSAEQLTFGPGEEEGLAVEQAGQSLISSVGVYEAALWIHDAKGERPLSSEGEVLSGMGPPAFGQNDSMIYYLVRRGASAELWRTMVDSDESEPMLPGVAMLAFDISPDGKQVVYATAIDKTTQLWLATLDRSSPPVKIGNRGGMSPHFGANGKILFQQSENNSNYLEQMNSDGSAPSRVVPFAISQIQSVSPAHRWVMALVPSQPQGTGPAPMAIPLDGGPPVRICESYCRPMWSTDGKFLFVPVEQPSIKSEGRSLAIPVGPGETLPEIPAGGIAPLALPSLIKGSQSIPQGRLIPGKDPEHFAYVKTSVHANLFRISLP